MTTENRRLRCHRCNGEGRVLDDGWREVITCKDCEGSGELMAAPSGVASSEFVVPRALSVKFIFAWYDLWVGIFWDSRKRKLYILPVPCVGVTIEFPTRHNVQSSGTRGQRT
jgi:hypothetical protein